jgi:nickel transport protein
LERQLNPTMTRVLPAVVIALAAWGLGVGAQPAQAHGIQSTLEQLNALRSPLLRGTTSKGQMRLETRFSSGLPAQDAAVRLVPPGGGTAIELGHTDASGQLSFALPARVGADWEVQVDAGSGHRDYLELPGTDPRHAHLPSMLRLDHVLAAQALAPLALVGLIGGLGSWLSRPRPPQR